jgi:hypothetical protein
MDRKNHLLFVGCRNELMVVMNADRGKLMATIPIGKGVDATAFDPGTNLAFSSNGDGTLTVVHEDSPEKFSIVQNVTTKRGAGTMALDTNNHRIFLVTGDFKVYPPAGAWPRPPIMPGSFTLLVMAHRQYSNSK